jgi:hypothetical protein
MVHMSLKRDVSAMAVIWAVWDKIDVQASDMPFQLMQYRKWTLGLLRRFRLRMSRGCQRSYAWAFLLVL